MGGYRGVRLWSEKPIYDHRLIKIYGELHHRETNEFYAEIWVENGWYSQSGSLKAKPFLKQDAEVKRKVWELIYQSVIPSHLPATHSMSDQEYDALSDPDYERVCTTHWKRFLLEIDLATGDVRQVPAESLVNDHCSRGIYPIPEHALLTEYFLDEDMNRPCHLGKTGDYRVRQGSSW